MIKIDKKLHNDMNEITFPRRDTECTSESLETFSMLTEINLLLNKRDEKKRFLNCDLSLSSFWQWVTL